MKILIIQTAFLGDIVLLAPLLESLKSYISDSEVHMLLSPAGISIFSRDTRVEKVIKYEKRGLDKGLSGFKRVLRLVREEKYDVIIDVHRYMRASLMTKLSGAKLTLGFKEAALSYLFNIKVMREGAHEVYKNHSLFVALIKELIDKNKLDINDRDYFLPKNSYSLFYDEERSNYFKDKYSANPLIAIAPGSVWATKRWPAAYFSKLINMLLGYYSENNTNAKILILGSDKDYEVCNSIYDSLNSLYTEKEEHERKVINLCGCLNLEEYTDLISAVDLLIGNDSAPQHIAAGLGKKIISIFGPTIKGFGYYPYTSNAVFIENQNIACRPCGIHGHKECPEGHHKCMNEINPKKVFNVIKEIV